MPERGINMRNQKGFTIIEMVIVMAILTIVSAIAYPRIASYMEMNREEHRKNHEYMVNKALMQYYALTGSYYKAPYRNDGTVMDDDHADQMLEDLRDITGAMINNADDRYKYIKTDGHDDANLFNCTIRAVKVVEAP
jgi:prepilin-type N-terminal cleavage/methylation domain-containing protein